MYQLTRPLFLLCETPLHAGSGSDLGVVDLPIQRERHTSYPKIEGSSLKGALRESFEGNFKPYQYLPTRTEPINYDVNRHTKKAEHQSPVSLAFGPEEGNDKAHAGALGFSDARLLLFPVKSMKGVFAWITCPALIDRFARELKLVQGFEKLSFSGAYRNHTWKDNECLAFGGSNIVANRRIILEEYTFILPEKNEQPVEIKLGEGKSQSLGAWLVAQGVGGGDNYWSAKLKTDIIVLSNDDFRDFVHLSTEVITRTKINNETGTVEKGGLFTEEYLPTESLLYSLVMSAPVFQKKAEKENLLLKNETEVMRYFKEGLLPIIQLGGNATLGKGMLRTKLLNPQPAKKDE